MAHFVRIPTAENLLSSMDSCVILCFFPVGTDLRIFAVINVGIQASFKLKYVAVRKMPSFVGTTYQCDQKVHKFAKYQTKSYQNFPKTVQILPTWRNFANLVTLLPTYLGIVLVAWVILAASLTQIWTGNLHIYALKLHFALWLKTSIFLKSL